MSVSRLLAIATIFVLATVAWIALGTSIVARTGEFDSRLRQEVTRLWGGEHVQVAPAVWVERSREVTERVKQDEADGAPAREVTRTVVDRARVTPSQSRIDVNLRLAHRQKGLLWYDTYEVTFTARYRVRNPDPVERRVGVELRFPSADALYDDFRFLVNGEPAGAVGGDLSEGLRASAVLPAGADAVLEVAYTSRGLDTWSYAFASEGVAEVSDFLLTMATDFADVDFPAGTISPGTHERLGDGARLTWRFDRLVTGQRIGMDLPERQNPGPLAARITAFAPVSLLFFLVVMVILGVLRNRNLHPLNYAFLSAAFFAFHLLLAYLVDHVSIHVAFAAASAVSVLLVVSYLRVVTGPAFALTRAGLAQLVFLVLFSYAFFFEGFTGLTVTIGAIVTLFVLMQTTARVDWEQVLGSAARREPAAGARP